MNSEGERTTSRPRVLHVSFFYDPQRNNIAYRLLEALDPAAFETVPLYLFAPRGGGASAPPEGLCLDAAPSDLRGLRRASLASTIRAAAGEVEVVVAHRMRTALLLDTAYGSSIAAGIVVVHGRHTLRRGSRRRRVLRRLRERWRFAAISGAVRADLEAAGIDPAQIVDLPNALDIEGVRAQQWPRDEARTRLGIEGGGFLFGAITRLEPKKGLSTLVDAMRSLPGDVRLVVLGDGPDRERLEASVRAGGLLSRVQFLGHVPEAYRVVRAFDALVHPSHEEGFGMVLLEAMAGERPMVATTAGGIPEVVGADASLVPPGDAAALRAAMDALAEAPAAERAGQGSALLVRARARFDLPRAHAVFRGLVAAAL